MQVHNGTLDKEVVSWVLKTTGTERIISIDLETKILDGKFLNNEMLLSVSVSRRINGSIETIVFVLDEETEEGEVRLLRKLDDFLREVRPLMVVGFNHTGYDNVLLAMKRRSWREPLWSIMDMLERCHMIDIKHAARFAIAEHDGTPPKILSLEKVLLHPMFRDLPLMNNKALASNGIDKGAKIYNMWKNDQDMFEAYSSADTHDTLLIFEKMFC